MEANSSSSSLGLRPHCTDSVAGTITHIIFIVINLLVFLPLSLLVLHLGLQRWRQQRSFATTSHSDVFTYHWAALELIYVLGFICYFRGRDAGPTELMTVGHYALSIFHPGQMCLHILTCVERHLAVVHPVTYLQLRRSGGVRIRNVSGGCVWLLVCGWIAVIAWYSPNVPYAPVFCFMVLALLVVSACSLSVLHVLIHPGPGGRGGRGENSRRKQRAFHTTAAIMLALWFLFSGLIVCIALENSKVLTDGEGCLVLMSSNYFTLPSNLVLPLLFLHRARKCVCCQCRKA